MSTIQDTDQFIVKRGDSYFTAKRNTVVEGLTVPNAKQGDQISGVAGKVFPSKNFVYDEKTGYLDVNFPNTLNFVGEVTEDLQPPADTQNLNTGDFYIVNPDLAEHPDGKLTLKTSEWKGVSDDEFTSVELFEGGNNYRGLNGTIPTFGEGVETGQRNLTDASKSYGFLLTVSVIDGFIRTTDAVISQGGFNYEVDDIIEFRQKTPEVGDRVYVKITDVSSVGAVTDFEFVQNEDGESNDRELVGGYYFASSSLESYSYGVETIPRRNNIQGSGMRLDLTMVQGEVVNATISTNSSHIAYKDGDKLFIVNETIGNVGEAIVGVKIDETAATGTITVTKNDKIIWTEKIIDTLRYNEFVLIKDSVSNSQITSIQVPVYVPGNNEGYGNPHYSIITQRSSTDENVYNISIKDAKVILTDTGDLDIYSSYSGFMSASDKQKLDSLTDDDIPEIVTTSTLNTVTGRTYSALKVEELEGRISISGKTADIGASGLTSIVSNTELSTSLSQKHNRVDEVSTKMPSLVANSHQTVDFFLPNNFYLLPNY
jgi:hypothetical protein